MSKQPHDQDEQKAPSGAQSASSEAPSGKPAAANRRRSRRYDKAGGKPASAQRASETADAAAPDDATAASPAASKTSAAAAGDNAADKGSATESMGSATESKGSATESKGSATESKGSATESKGSATESKGSATESKGSATRGKSAPAKPAGTAASSSAKASGKADKPTGSASNASSGGKTNAGMPDKAAASAGGGARGSATNGGGKGGGKAGRLALVLVILLAIGVVFLGWQAWQKLDAQQQRLAALPGEVASQSELGDLRGQLSQIESAESERDAALESTLADLRGEFADYRSSVDQTLDEVLDELSREQDTDERDWLHAEAAYLLRLANQRLQLERDVEGAAALLRTADARLQEADNPALTPVRREIASELAALESVPQVDRTGIYLALNAQQEQLAGQPLAQDIEEMAADAALEEAPTGGWQQQLSRFGEELKDLVTVRQHDQALEALIAPEQEAYLRQSVRLVLEQSQLALLKEEEALYEASLDKALTLIRGYYDTDASGVQSVIERLESLKQRDIRPQLPDISDSQQALATFIERRFESRDDGQGDDA